MRPITRCGKWPRLDVLRIAARLIVVLAIAITSAAASTGDGDPVRTDDPGPFDIVRLAGPFEFPWSIALLPEGEILVTERPGRLQLVQKDGLIRKVAGLPPIYVETQAGLLDVAIDPDFEKNSVVYLSYVHGVRDANQVRVLRARLDRAKPALKDHKVIFKGTYAAGSEQYGGRLAVTADGMLFLTLGDRWMSNAAQDLTDTAGSVIRIRTDGSVPGDNPFVSVAGARAEIWSRGHRNALGLAFDPRNGRLWSHENGPQGGDEINLILRGANHGWPIATHGRDYSGETIGEPYKDGMEPPLHVWTPSIAPSGLAIDTAAPETVLWLGALAGQALYRVVIDGERVTSVERFVHEELGRIRDVRVGRDGALYVVNDDAEGSLHVLQPLVEQAGAGRRSPL